MELRQRHHWHQHQHHQYTTGTTSTTITVASTTTSTTTTTPTDTNNIGTNNISTTPTRTAPSSKSTVKVSWPVSLAVLVRVKELRKYLCGPSRWGGACLHSVSRAGYAAPLGWSRVPHPPPPNVRCDSLGDREQGGVEGQASDDPISHRGATCRWDHREQRGGHNFWHAMQHGAPPFEPTGVRRSRSPCPATPRCMR
jgi:hypothetical protein